MSVIASEIVFFGSAVMPDTEATTAIGGAIDLTKRIAFGSMGPFDNIRVSSSSAADTTQTVTYYGRHQSGATISETVTLNGTSTVTTVKDFGRIDKIDLSTACAGTVSISRMDTIVIVNIPAGVLQIRRPFYGAYANAAGGATRTYYEKIFVRNQNATFALTSSTLAITDGTSTVAFAIEAVANGNDTNGAGNQLTHTGGYTFNASSKPLANGQVINPLENQGIWLKLTLPAGQNPIDTFFSLLTSGQSI